MTAAGPGPLSILAALLADIDERIADAVQCRDTVARERAELDYAAVAAHWCDRARDLGLPEPAEVKERAGEILRRYRV